MAGFRAFAADTGQGSGDGKPPLEQIIPEDAVIDQRKLTEYLLRELDVDDKSKFIEMLGFNLAEPEVVRDAILKANVGKTAFRSRHNPNGTSYTVSAELAGSENRRLVKFVWNFTDDGSVHLITMYPNE